MRWVLVLLFACGGSSAAPTDESTTEATETGGEQAIVDPQVEADREAGFTEEDPDLPEAPWAAAPIPNDAAPPELMQAWSEAENRDWCAPIVPAETEGRARVSEYAGGWSVEFDVRGQPGMRPSGRACARCGRGNFGIAGTAIRVDAEEETEAEEQRFRDGSYLRIEPSEEAEGDTAVAHAATIKIRGQECVYQVWSLAGAEALEALVSQLRFVSQ